MIVRFTNQQLAQVLKAVEAQGGSALDSALTGWLWQRSRYGGHRVDVLMPAVGWNRVEKLMFDRVYDDTGYRRTHIASTSIRAHRAIRAALNARETHPALSERGAIGFIAEFIPAWRQDIDPIGRVWSPYPIADAPFAALAPVYSTGEQRTTRWVPAENIPPRPILNPAEHWKLVQAAT